MSKTNILIVDDQQINYDILEEILSNKYNLFYASNGQKALEFLQQKKQIIHLILLDLQMPEMNGEETMEVLKNDAFFRKIPVIIISADNSDESLVKAYELGAVDYFTKPFIAKIVEKTVDSVLSLYGKEFIDPLTGGYNRAGFISEVESVLSKNEDKEYVLLYFNVKNFKAVNDLVGLSGGDSILCDIYESLLASDYEPIVVARIESDHFACLILEDKLDFDLIENSFDSQWTIDDKTLHLFLRLGIYYIENKNLPISAMIDRAKLALALIVDEYTKPYQVFDNTMSKNYVDQADILSRFNRAIENKEFKVYYQPVIDVATGKLASAEALVRWDSPRTGLISPGVFIPVLEGGGFISKLDNYVINEVYGFIRSRINENKTVVPVSINLSWMDFYDEKIQQNIQEKIDYATETSQHIRYEVTETSLAANEKRNEVGILEYVRRHNMKILLDDFGSGYSSFGMIQSYNFDILKIDMSFVRQIENNAKVRIIIRSIIDMCHQIGIKVVAEGVENVGQRDFLKDSECDYIQGYFYSKPLPMERFIEFIEDHQFVVPTKEIEEAFRLRSYYKAGISFLTPGDRNLCMIDDSSIMNVLTENGGVGLISGYCDDSLTIGFVSDMATAFLNYTVQDFNTLCKNSLYSLLDEKYRKDFDIENPPKQFELITKDGSHILVNAIVRFTKTSDGKRQWLLAIRKEK